MSNTGQYTNIAFISYSHNDRKWANWLHKKLEYYKLPSHILKQHPNLEFSYSPRHVFKDTTDLSAGLLNNAIKQNLNSSKYLIVVCSPQSAMSKWVNKEVQTFIDSNREEYIIPFIVEGRPDAKNLTEECLPEALRKLVGEKELLGINIDENGRDAAVVKVVARMFNLQFDALWQRFKREEKRKRLYTILSLSCIAVISIIFGFHFYSQNRALLESQSKMLSERVVRLVEDGDTYTARLLTEELFDGKYPETKEACVALQVADDGREFTLFGHLSFVESVAFSSNCKYLVSGGRDGMLKLWDVVTGKCVKNLRNTKFPVYSVAFSNEDRHIASGGVFGLCIYETSTGKCINLQNPEGGFVRSVSFSPDGRFLATGSDSIIRIWDISTWK